MDRVVIRAVIFDFDGVIVETEGPDYLAWREVWASFGQDLALEEWASCIGTSQGASTFHPFEALVRRTGLELAEAEVRARKREIATRLLDQSPVMDGVADWLADAVGAGMGLGIASSSELEWIERHLGRLGLRDLFGAIVCLDHCGVPKPDPSSYRLACQRLGVDPVEALAIEDSLHGLSAAKKAGLTCVVVPTAMTAHMGFSGADLVLSSLGAASLSEVLSRL